MKTINDLDFLWVLDELRFFKPERAFCYPNEKQKLMETAYSALLEIYEYNHNKESHEISSCW